MKCFPGRSASVTCLSEYFFHFQNLKALQCDGSFMCQGETSLHACIHSSCEPCVKGSGQMLWPAHLFGGRFKERSAASCCSFFSALFRLDSELGSSHDESWCYLHCVLIVAVQDNMGVISGRILRRFHRHEVRDNVAKTRHRAAPHCPATLYFGGLESTLFSISCCIPPTASFISQTVRDKVENRAKVMF